MWRHFEGTCTSFTEQEDVSDIGDFGKTVLRAISRSVDILIIGNEATVTLKHSGNQNKSKMEVISSHGLLTFIPKSGFLMSFNLCQYKKCFRGSYHIPNSDDIGQITVKEMDYHKIQAQAAL